MINQGLARLNLKMLRRDEAELFERSHMRYQRLLRRLNADESLLFEPSFSSAMLPPGAREYLRHDNPRLLDLQRRYRASAHAVLVHSLWTDEYVAKEVDLRSFRGDQAYVWQFRDLNTEVHYLITLQYLRAMDQFGLLGRLIEDELFGAQTLHIDDMTISRDLLDSMNEIYFIERQLQISGRSDFNILDIGAGYGRLAHRLSAGFPNFGHIFCVDAVAVSTFICEYYLSFRGVDRCASVVPVDELDALLAHQRIDLAVGIHSLSECPLASIRAWLDVLAAHDVRYVFLVPNQHDHQGTELRSLERGSAGLVQADLLPAIADRGYELVVREPKYRDELVQRHGLSPTHYYLFERT